MRVLFVPRGDVERAFGGDILQMSATAHRLRDLGVELDVGPPERALAERYDVVHLWTPLQFPEQLLAQLDELQPVRHHSKVVLSTIWAPFTTMAWMRAAKGWLYGRSPDLGALDIFSAEHDLRQLANRELQFSVDGSYVYPYAAHPGAALCRHVIERVDAMLPNAYMEAQAIFTNMGVHCDFFVVPNAVDVELFSAADPQAVPAEIRDRPFAMMSARFDSRKQQDFVLLALKHLDVPLVFVGGIGDVETFHRFKAIGATRRAPVFLLPMMPQDQLRNLYAAASVHLMPSLFESPGLASLEAALLDCSLVVGGLGYETEYFREEAYYCDPCDAFSIARAVERAFANHEADSERRASLRDRITRDYTWLAAAQATARAYERVTR